jgi:dihydrolipoamide dehydrogenase
MEDPESSDTVTKSFKKRGMTIYAGAKVKKATVAKDKTTLELEVGGKTENIESEKVLMAAGRAVNTEDLGLQETS